MKNIRMLAVLCIALVSLSGCVTYGETRPGYSYSNSSILGASGAVIGSALLSSDPAVGMVIGGLTGYYLGSEMDRQDAEVGRTDCQATIFRSYNRDGTIASVSRNDEQCRSRRSVSGYRSGYNR